MSSNASTFMYFGDYRYDPTDKLYSEVISYATIASLVLVSLSFFFSFFVLLLLSIKRKEHRNDIISTLHSSPHRSNLYTCTVTNIQKVSYDRSFFSWKMCFSSLTHYSIHYMIVSDVLFAVSYFGASLLQVLLNFKLVSQEARMYVLYLAYSLKELSESFVISSCIWSVIISGCIFLTVKSINHDQEQSPRDSKRHSDGTQGHVIPLYMDVDSFIRNYETRFVTFTFGIPLAACLFWSVLEILYIVPEKKGVEAFLANVVPDLIKSLTFITLEVLGICMRVAVYLSTNKILSKNLITRNSPKAAAIKLKQRKLIKQLSMYSLPFLMFGVWIVIYRLYNDSTSISYAITNGVDEYEGNSKLSLFNVVILTIHLILYPLRIAMNALVYCILTNWFKKKCCSADIL
ncbi:7 TM domain-containing transmembrane protein [Acrasis kona]|uniref:7 TM domain-containing transmembrane protein n=1 Tax=Acrasis kona TaxID=1008807 RepID=A0AAW2ZRJ8_9EUKA